MMIYKANIEKLKLCGCGDEGNLIIKINENQFSVYYQAPDDWILNYLTSNGTIKNSKILGEFEVNAEIKVDLYVVFGNYILSNEKKKFYPISTEISGGNFNGEIVKINSDDSFRIDCGLIIDIENESNIGFIEAGDYIKTSGTYKVYFPDTEYSLDT